LYAGVCGLTSDPNISTKQFILGFSKLRTQIMEQVENEQAHKPVEQDSLKQGNIELF
jgi:hypothetical protein